MRTTVVAPIIQEQDSPYPLLVQAAVLHSVEAVCGGHFFKLRVTAVRAVRSSWSAGSCVMIVEEGSIGQSRATYYKYLLPRFMATKNFELRFVYCSVG